MSTWNDCMSGRELKQQEGEHQAVNNESKVIILWFFRKLFHLYNNHKGDIHITSSQPPIS